jgi:hypothetical protein
VYPETSSAEADSRAVQKAKEEVSFVYERMILTDEETGISTVVNWNQGNS